MKQAPADKEAEDQKVAAELKRAVYDLRALMAKADKRGITCTFNIAKVQKGGWQVTQCEIHKKF